MSTNNIIDFANGVQPVEGIWFANEFSGSIIIEEKKKVVKKAKRFWIKTIIWVDRSKLD